MKVAIVCQEPGRETPVMWARPLDDGSGQWVIDSCEPMWHGLECAMAALRGFHPKRFARTTIHFDDGTQIPATMLVQP